MRIPTSPIGIGLCVALAAVSGSQRQAAAQHLDLQQHIDGLTWAQPDQGRQTVEALLRQDASRAVQGLIAMLAPPDKGGDAQARFALHGLAMAVRNGEHEPYRVRVSTALCAALPTCPDPEIKAFLIRQIALAGGDEAVQPLAACLAAERLRNPAAAALVRIGTPAAAKALRQALAGADGDALLTIVQALGKLRDPAAADAILPLTEAGDPIVRQTALIALADMGAAAAQKAVLAAAAAENKADRQAGIHAAALLARRLHQAERTPAALDVCTLLQILDGGTIPALAVRIEIQGQAAMPMLMHAARQSSGKAREALLRLAETLPGHAVTMLWCDAAAEAENEWKAAVITMLGRRGDPAAADTVKEALNDADAQVRRAARNALGRFGGERALEPLVAHVAAGDKETAEHGAAVLRWVAADHFDRTVASALPEATPAGKAALLGLLAARRAANQSNAIFACFHDPDRTVRTEAFKAMQEVADADDVPRVMTYMLETDAAGDQKAARKIIAAACRQDPEAVKHLLDAMKTADANRRAALLRTLGQIGGHEALKVVVEDTAKAEETIRDAAVRALTAWPDPQAAPHLLTMAKTAANEVHRVLALRGYIRVVTMPSGPSPGKTAEMLTAAWEAARTDSDRKLVLSGLATVRHTQALRLVTQAMEQDALVQEAAAAALAICLPDDRNDNGVLTHDAYRAMMKIVDLAPGEDAVKKAREHLTRFPVGGGTNIALGKPVETSCPQQGDKAPAKAVDGKLGKLDAWFGNQWPSWITVDLLEPTEIEAIRLIFYWDGRRLYQYTVETSLDRESWTQVVDNSKNDRPADARGLVHRFKPRQARYVRLNILRNSVNEAVHLVEFEVYAAGQAPETFAGAEPPKPAAAKAIGAPPLPEADDDGFISLFNGKDLSGWMGSVNGYAAEDGLLICKEKGGGKLLTQHRFSDFVLSFEFNMPKGANNGLAIRSPAEGNPAYAGMELQIIDNKGYRDVHNYELKPWQTHGSIYGCVPAKTGALKAPGEWNHQLVTAVGSHITVVLNGRTILDTDLDELTETADGKGLRAHPGIKRQNGHLGWLGHGARVAFRNIRIKPLHPYTQGPHNMPPEGFAALFNGTDLNGWKGLLKRPYDNPEKRAELSADNLAELQREADADMSAHWTVKDGMFVFDGKGRSICTAKDYADFELYVDWKIKAGGDSGIYLRGSPQVQIWDPGKRNVGSGGLYNNKKHPSNPAESADNPIGEWNRFFIRMVGEKVSVRLNGVLVVDNVVMENYWNRAKPISPKGQIELQNHGNTLWFRNIYIRELKTE